jgi:hypothetical protein
MRFIGIVLASQTKAGPSPPQANIFGRPVAGPPAIFLVTSKPTCGNRPWAPRLSQSKRGQKRARKGRNQKRSARGDFLAVDFGNHVEHGEHPQLSFRPL